MKVLGKLLLASILIFVIGNVAGCKYFTVEESSEMTELAVVEDVVFTPSVHSSSGGIAMTSKGGMGISAEDIRIPEKYAIVFRCQHGKFIIEGTTAWHKELWSRLVRNQNVTIYYKEVYRVTHDGENVLNRRLIRYNFIDAK